MASTAFEKASRMVAGPEQAAAFLGVAELYEQAFSLDPSADEAPEAALNGAYAFKRANRWERALNLYRLFLARYPTPEKIAELRKKDPRRAEERIRWAREASERLAAGLVLVFDYRSAAVLFDSLGRTPIHSEEYRRTSAHNATILFANLGEAESAESARKVFLALNPPLRDKITIDRIVAQGGFHDWRPSPADTDALRAARKTRKKALETFVAAYEKAPEAAQDVMEVAYHLFQLTHQAPQSSAAKWCKKAKKAYESAVARAPSRRFWTPDQSTDPANPDCRLSPAAPPPSSPKKHPGKPLSPPPSGVAPPTPAPLN